jgi:hypothetical protein
MSGVRRDDRDHFPIQFGQLRIIQVFIDSASQHFGIALIPLARNR